MKPFATAVALALLALTAALYAAGVARADPGIGVARSDLEVLKSWKATGRLEDLASDPSHLPKLGYMIFLRAMLPREGTDAGEVRRMLAFNAAVILGGLATAAWALWRRAGPRAAIVFLLFGLLYLPARDSTDYVASEPLAIGVSLFFFAALVGWAGPLCAVLLGLACAAILPFRPNLGWILLATALAAIVSRREGRRPATAGLLAGFLAGLALLVGGERITGLPASSLRAGGSRALLWGTADYYWPPDVGGWPVGQTREESARLQREKALQRWKELVARGTTDAARSLLWRSTHAVLSCEQLPARWSAAAYQSADRFLRGWWWLAAVVLFAAAAAGAAGGSGELRFVPLLLLLASVAQGVAFGADPRLSLPFIPLVVLSLVVSRPPRLAPGAIAAGGLAAALLLAAALIVPDTANSDFAVLRGPGRSLEQEIPASRFPATAEATVHLRLLKPQDVALGLEISGGGELLHRREADDTSATPAALSLVLRGASLERARREGLRIEAKTFGDAAQSEGFYYFPSVPQVLRPPCRVDGSEDLPSGYGGTTRGSIPVWVHAGLD